MCELTKYAQALILNSHGQRQQWNAAAEQLWKAVDSHWIAIFGPPKRLRTDAEAAWTSAYFSKQLGTLDIQRDVAPAEAHHRQGIIERLIKELRHTLSVLDAALPGEDATAMLRQALRSHNDLERVDGISASMAAVGRRPGWLGTLHASTSDEAIGSLTVAENVKMMLESEVAMKTAKLQSAVERATRARNRPLRVYNIGDVVYYWRSRTRLLYTTDAGE